MIHHHVAFRLRRPFSAAAREAFLDALRSFAEDPPHATGPGAVHEDLGRLGDHPRAADALVAVTFEDGAALCAYMSDPRHRAFVAEHVEPACEGWWAVQSVRA